MTHIENNKKFTKIITKKYFHWVIGENKDFAKPRALDNKVYF